MRLSRLITPALAGAAIVAALAGPAAAAAPGSDLPHGIDVSNHDRGVDWGDDGLDFGIAKATEGVHFKDGTFAGQWKEMRDNGVARGAYHFGHPKNDPVKEAEYFLTAVRAQGLQPGDILALDLEVTDGRSSGDVNAWAKRWLEHVTRQTGVKPFLYTSWSFAQENGAGLGDYPLWVAHYGREPGEVKAPRPWKDWTIHQYEATDHDHNVSRISPDELRKLGQVRSS
ncbi:glycoside hydrolase family 25 protein [Spirillospora sp. NPDC047279]|uniref:glycoside hydrolase family 25 protein n=1 Tax=Spirillospora sp. NPDC047279 TaxID=3155478 RepID=UPI0033CCEB0B